MKHYMCVCVCVCVCDMREAKGEGGITFISSNLDPGIIRPQSVLLLAVRAQACLDTDTHMRQAATQSPGGTYTSDGYYSHSLRRPLGVCSFLWM